MPEQHSQQQHWCTGCHGGCRCWRQQQFLLKHKPTNNSWLLVMYHKDRCRTNTPQQHPKLNRIACWLLLPSAAAPTLVDVDHQCVTCDIKRPCYHTFDVWWLLARGPSAGCKRAGMYVWSPMCPTHVGGCLANGQEAKSLVGVFRDMSAVQDAVRMYLSYSFTASLFVCVFLRGLEPHLFPCVCVCCKDVKSGR